MMPPSYRTPIAFRVNWLGHEKSSVTAKDAFAFYEKTLFTPTRPGGGKKMHSDCAGDVCTRSV